LLPDIARFGQKTGLCHRTTGDCGGEVISKTGQYLINCAEYRGLLFVAHPVYNVMWFGVCVKLGSGVRGVWPVIRTICSEHGSKRAVSQLRVQAYIGLHVISVLARSYLPALRTIQLHVKCWYFYDGDVRLSRANPENCFGTGTFDLGPRSRRS